jgi:hypothetical protein
MRTHEQIVRDFGPTNLYRALPSVGVKVAQSTPQRWAERGSIPGEYWQALADLKIASLKELAAGADGRRKADEQ